MIILGGSKRLATIFPARSIAISPGSGLLEPRTKSRVFQCNEQNKSFMFSPSRLMSSFPPGIRTAYPQYTVLGPENMLTVKLIMPGYRMARGNALIVDYKRKGRMLFEFTPRDSLGKFSYDDKAAMGLSVEEVGLLCNQLPQYEVEIVRNPSQYQDAEGGVGIAGGVVTSTASDVPLKSMKFSPGEGSSVRFILEDNSVDGNSQSGAREVVVQAGEFEVLASIMRSSLPILAGWSPLLDIAVHASQEEALNGGFGDSSGGGDFF